MLYFAFKKNKAFTLIELLVVIAIIGILSSVVLGSLNTARAKARDAKRKQDMKMIANALQMYYDDNGGSFANLLASDGVNASVNGQTFVQAYYFSTPTYPSSAGYNSWSTLQSRLSKYMAVLPTDPKNKYNWSGYNNSGVLPLSVTDGYYFVGIASTVVDQPINACGSNNTKVRFFIESSLENINDVGTIRNAYPNLYGCVGSSDGRAYTSRIWSD